MKLEHIAFNVADPVAVAAWYGRHCGFRVVRPVPGPAPTHFLADADATILEIYCNPPERVPDYRALDPLQFHLALTSSDPQADARRLVSAGAVWVNETRLDDGSHLVMLRNPWGLALKLCKRAQELLGTQAAEPHPVGGSDDRLLP
ncbi:MAG: VOC family protein [Planctomycetes bacterium]|nr:VOC family protein [Planctomycetota bacterium]